MANTMCFNHIGWTISVLTFERQMYSLKTHTIQRIKRIFCHKINAILWMWLNDQLGFLDGIQDGIVFLIFQKMNNSQLGQFVSDEQEKDLVLRVLGAFCTAGATPQQLEGTYLLLFKTFYYHSIINLFNIPILSLISLPYFLIFRCISIRLRTWAPFGSSVGAVTW